MQKEIIEKIFSGRYFVTTVIISTFSAIMIMLTIALLKKVIEISTYAALFGTFSLIAKEICENYFRRTDRKGEPNEPNSSDKKPV